MAARILPFVRGRRTPDAGWEGALTFANDHPVHQSVARPVSYRTPSEAEIAALFRETPDARTVKLPRNRVRGSRGDRGFRGARRTVIALGLTAAVSIPAIVWFTGDDEPGSTPGATSTDSSTPSPASSPQLTPGKEALTWHSLSGVDFPVSSTEGPMTFTSRVSAGFSSSDRGAALAATHIVYRASAAPGPESFEPALAEQIAGPGAPQLAETVRADYRAARDQAGLPEGAPLPDGMATFLGYRVSNLPDGNRAVQIVEQAPDVNGVAQPFAFDVVVTRARSKTGVEDWKVVAPTGGTWSDAFTQLASVPSDLVPFTPSPDSLDNSAEETPEGSGS